MVLINDLNQHINAVMETMGWPEDVFMPIANDENRKLMESIEQRMEAKRMKIEHREQLNERVNLLKEHYHNAQNGVVQNLVKILKKTIEIFLLGKKNIVEVNFQKLLDAHRRQCDSEYHMFKLAENDLATSENLKADLKKEVMSLDEQNLAINSTNNELKCQEI